MDTLSPTGNLECRGHFRPNLSPNQPSSTLISETRDSPFASQMDQPVYREGLADADQTCDLDFRWMVVSGLRCQLPDEEFLKHIKDGSFTNLNCRVFEH
jgi:hypothetical protein